MWAVFANGEGGIHNLRLDREDGPAQIATTRDGQTVETWYRQGKPYQPSAHERMKWEARKIARGTPLHTDSLAVLAGEDPSMGAAGENWTKTTGLKTKKCNFHREGGPAIVRRDPATGAIVMTAWYRSGFPHRDGGLPYQEVFHASTGFRVEATYATNRKIGRFGAPALLRWNPDDGRVVEEHWLTHGMYLRPSGPAIVQHNPATGEVCESRWFANSKRTNQPTEAMRRDWETEKAQQGGPFTPGLDQAPARPQRTAGVKAAAATAAAKATEPERAAHQDER
jgi:hypothetical protein